jgi:hypothetical protein
MLMFLLVLVVMLAVKILLVLAHRLFFLFARV